MSEVPKIESEIQKLNPSAIIELFELDTTNIVGGTVLRFYPGLNGLLNPIIWNGNEYLPFPIQVEGFEWKGSGTLPRPTIRVANVTGLFGAMVREMEDLIGAKVTRRRTFAKYLDEANFPNGNPNADPTAEVTPDVFFVNRKSSENRTMIEFELAAMLDVHGLKLPRRMIVANVCPWKYRGAECQYAGPPVADSNDTPTTDPLLDDCGRRVESCKLRFPDVLPFGGFPGAALVRQS